MNEPGAQPVRRWISILLWTTAVVLMLSTAVYQRLTGPTHPLRGTISLDGEVAGYRLIRSEVTTKAATVRVPAVSPDATATLHWRRYPTNEDFVPRPMRRVDDRFEAELPVQPAAGKVEYYLEIQTSTATVQLPDGDPVVLRYKDPVPAAVLIPHIACMFFGVLFGLRAGLAAAVAPAGLRRLAWTTLGLLTVGGMILGPVVQKYAFGAFWAGWPHGGDLTDNKSLVMWVVWILACAVVGIRSNPMDGRRRAAVLLATVVMTVVYLIPHSLRGSELDYEAVDDGVHPAAAVTTSES